MNDLSPTYVAETAALARERLAQLAEVDAGALPPDAAITLAVGEPPAMIDG